MDTGNLQSGVYLLMIQARGAGKKEQKRLKVAIIR
jgi:hypothetical protein